jgi:hypothetical protein
MLKMKNLSKLLIVLFVFAACQQVEVKQANYKPEIKDFRGIGYLKIFADTTILDTLEHQIRKTHTLGQFSHWKPVEKIHDRCNSKIFKVQTFDFFGVEISSLELSFYNDSLIALQCSHSEGIDKILEQLYGNGPQIERKAKTRKIKGKELLEYYNEKIWENETVRAVSLDEIGILEIRGSQTHNSSFTIEAKGDIISRSKNNDCLEDYHNQNKIKQETEKTKQLDKFK